MLSAGNISIHTLRVEGDAERPGYTPQNPDISIHTLRVEGDLTVGAQKALEKFQSTPSAWRVTGERRNAR